MKRGVSYIELKKAFTKLLPQSIEIENEVLLIDNAELLNSHSEPYRTDCTTTLIYFEGETTFFCQYERVSCQSSVYGYLFE